MLTLHLIIYDHWEQLSFPYLPGSPEWWRVPHYRPDKRPFPKLFRTTCRRSLWGIISEKNEEHFNKKKEKDNDLLAMEISLPSHVPFALEHFLLLMTVCVVSLKNQLNELLIQAMFRFLLIHLKIWEAFPPLWVVPHPYTQPTLPMNFTPDFGMHAGVYT